MATKPEIEERIEDLKRLAKMASQEAKRVTFAFGRKILTIRGEFLVEVDKHGHEKRLKKVGKQFVQSPPNGILRAK